MKKLLIALAFLPLLCQAQDPDIIQNQSTPGNELLKAKNIMNAGFAITGLGLSSLMISEYGNPEYPENYSDTGLGLSVAGFIVIVIGVQHIGKAGNTMNSKRLGVTLNNGIGLRYRI